MKGRFRGLGLVSLSLSVGLDLISAASRLNVTHDQSLTIGSEFLTRQDFSSNDIPRRVKEHADAWRHFRIRRSVVRRIVVRRIATPSKLKRSKRWGFAEQTDYKFLVEPFKKRPGNPCKICEHLIGLRELRANFNPQKLQGGGLREVCTEFSLIFRFQFEGFATQLSSNTRLDSTRFPGIECPSVRNYCFLEK